MAVFQDFRFLDEAVDSVLEQTFKDYEFIIVDDGNDRDDLFEAIRLRDKRIRIVKCNENVGLAAAVNRGIAEATAEIIVRLDADDACYPDRVRQLLSEFNADPELGLVGSAVTLIDESGRELRNIHMPTSDLEIRWTILFHNPFYHPATAFRRKVFLQAGGYRESELVSQDHYLWLDMMPFCRMRNLREPLIKYRSNTQGLTHQNSAGARNRTHSIRKQLWAEICLEYDLYDDGLARDVSSVLRGHVVPLDRRRAASYVLERVLEAFLCSSVVQRNATTRAEGIELGARLRTLF